MRLYNKTQLTELKEQYGEDYEETIIYALSSLADMMQVGDVIAGTDYGYTLMSDTFSRWESTDGKAIISSLSGIIRDYVGLDYELFKIYAPLDWFQMYVIKRYCAPKDQRAYEDLRRGSVK
jgi:hypothetical protein